MIAPQPFFQWRGSPIRVHFNALALVDLGFRVDLLVMPIGEDCRIPGAHIHRAANPFGLRQLVIGPSLRKLILDFFLLGKALRLGFRNRYDIVHGIEDAGLLAVIVAACSGGGVIYEKHSDPGSYRKGLLRSIVLFLYRQAERSTVRHADAVIATGPALARQVSAISPAVSVKHIFDIPSSLVEAEAEEVEQLRRRLQQSEGELLITYVGSFAVYQGIELMFECMPSVLTAVAAARFVVIGGSASDIERWKAWLKKRGCEDRVSFLGRLPPDDLPAYLRASDLLLSPRVAGSNTPLKLLDYLKAGRAIVATDLEANRLILDESNAVLVTPSAEALSEGICRLLSDADLRQRLGRAAVRALRETYNYAEFKRRLGACYEEVLER